MGDEYGVLRPLSGEEVGFVRSLGSEEIEDALERGRRDLELLEKNHYGPRGLDGLSFN